MYGGNGPFQYSKGNNSKTRKPRVTVHVFACHLMVVFFVKFHENMSTNFKVMERTQKLVTDTHTHREKTKTITPLHCIFRMPGV